ncbi:MAG: tetratricopeptide repeat protein [Bacteroidales bacterium]|nr:tetratricopeptide repeat protein [Bacteroidales bacterium]
MGGNMFISRYLIKVISAIIIISFWGSLNAQTNNLIELGALEEQKSNYGLAIDYYKKALEKNNNPSLYIKIGNIFEENFKDNDKALDVYKKGLDQFPMNFDLNTATMRLLLINDQIDEGIEKYIFLSKINKQNKRYVFPSYFLYQYKNLIAEGDFLSFCQKYIKINPSDFVLRNFLADEYFNKGDFINAIKELEILIKEKDNYYLPFNFFNLGICYYKIMKYEEALEYFNKAKQIEGGMPKEFIENKIDAITEKLGK